MLVKNVLAWCCAYNFPASWGKPLWLCKLWSRTLYDFNANTHILSLKTIITSMPNLPHPLPIIENLSILPVVLSLHIHLLNHYSVIWTSNFCTWQWMVISYRFHWTSVDFYKCKIIHSGLWYTSHQFAGYTCCAQLNIGFSTLPMLRLRSSKGQGCKVFFKPFKPCHAVIYWIALAK